MTEDKTPRPAHSSISRRRFLSKTAVSSAGAAALSFTVVHPERAFGAAANEKLKLGMIGCGGRGTRVGGLFQKHGGFELWAAADYFQDRVDGWGDRYGIDKKRRFTGLSCYEKLLESGVDAVAIESPPYFHPEQAAAAVDAGAHVYLAKPIAVDAPGCRSVGDSGKLATAKNQCFLVDFQTRADKFYIEALRRVREGAIGQFAFGESTYHAGCPFTRLMPMLRDGGTNPETRLRAWGLCRDLSGDIITEQNIHTLDVASWIMDEEPEYAVGTGGLKGRPDVGTCWDHFTILFQYPRNVGVTFSSRQFHGHGTQPEGIRNRMFGSDGVLETQYGGDVLIRGKSAYPGGNCRAIYNQGIIDNIATFHRSIIDGKYDNPTVAPSVRSNLVTILGRQAAYRSAKVHWYQIVKSNERCEPDLDGLQA